MRGMASRKTKQHGSSLLLRGELHEIIDIVDDYDGIDAKARGQVSGLLGL